MTQRDHHNRRRGGDHIDRGEGWTFADANRIDWQPLIAGMAMKALGSVGGRAMALFRFEAGYIGDMHVHADAEFVYILEGTAVSEGIRMSAGHAYAAAPGTVHTEFRSESGVVLLSVFAPPGA